MQKIVKQLAKQLAKQPKLSEVIEAQLEQMILQGQWQVGQKLPAERELAKQFEVSRPSIREAIQKLEAKNLVSRKQGDGTFVNDNLSLSLATPFKGLTLNHGEGAFDVLEFRLGTEGMSAYYAALRGTPANFADIQLKYDNIGLAQLENDCRVEAQAVFDLYLAICVASHNAVFLHLAQSMESLIVDHVESNLTILIKRPDVFDKIRDYRKRLLNAILTAKPEKAWSASHNHLMFIEKILLEEKQQQRAIKRSMRRMQRFE